MNVVIPPFDLSTEYDKPKENWKRPARSERGDRDWLTLYVVVGRALSQWEALEICLGELFMLLVESPSLAASRAYGALASVPARKSALEFAGAEFFDNAQIDQRNKPVLDKILANYTEASSRRNDIAHGIVTRFEKGSWEGPGGFLVPAEYNSRRTTTVPSYERALFGKLFATPPGFTAIRHAQFLDRAAYAYTAADVKAFMEKFYNFAVTISFYHQTVRADYQRVHYPGHGSATP
jgi:hypothetical protein